ncbi:MAG: hypothetical protein ACJARE_003648 [Paracoccaceae bacterium]|jgi:hypothetical protein
MQSLGMLAAAILSSGCAGMMSISEATAPPVCPTLYHYEMSERLGAADDLADLPPGSPVLRMIGNHGAQQAEIRTCHAAANRMAR